MKPSPAKQLRCAVYTRVSTDNGLEQEFNSLDAQREASEAYIKSQSHEGWRLVRKDYDDGGYSGGSMERPALQRLLADIKAKAIDVIVVYKVDRLTRSLADFAKLVELFDAHDVSFVSVTQSFNTTTSMGRLTLNVLLSFAQFEREVTSERIRDKIAASKKKGLWMGGVVPLGYRIENRKLLIVGEEARIVRMLFERYLELGSLPSLLTELNGAGIRTRQRTLSSGRQIGGVPFTRGPLAALLKNRMYIGEINHQGQSYPGEQTPIIDKHLFEEVQAKLAQNLQTHHTKRSASDALLLGRIVDDRGNTMTPVHSRKKGIKHRYYVSRAFTEGRKHEAGSVRRASAPDVEDTVCKALKSLMAGNTQADVRSIVQTATRKVVLTKGEIQIELTSDAAASLGQSKIAIAWSPKPSRVARQIIPSTRDDRRGIRSETRATLVRAIAKGRLWLGELSTNKVPDIETIAMREDRSSRSITMTLSLAFLAPDIVEAAISGRLPHGLGITRLSDLPMSWAKQREILGLSPAK